VHRLMHIPIANFAMLMALAMSAAAAQPSALWGEHGEKYDPAGPLPDFSFAGYGRRRSRNVRRKLP